MSVRVYSKRFPVPADAIDRQGHVSNLAYVAWMQDVAIEHSVAVGWPMERYLGIGAGWVVRSHFVEYLRPVFPGERLAVHTWLPQFTHRATPRRYLFVREDDTELVARAETRWVFIDLATGRRRALPDELVAAFEVVDDDAEARGVAGLDRAAKGDR
jgi:acyl-CoA thioester hydrolase